MVVSGTLTTLHEARSRPGSLFVVPHYTTTPLARQRPFTGGRNLLVLPFVLHHVQTARSD